MTPDILTRFGLKGLMLGAALTLAASGLAGYYDVLGGLSHQIHGGLTHQVTEDFLARYTIAKRSGTAIDTCTYARLVATAYLQEHDERQYRRWKQIEQNDCER